MSKVLYHRRGCTNSKFKSQCFFMTPTWPKLHARIHFERKDIVFKKL